MATKTKAGGDGLALPPGRNARLGGARPGPPREDRRRPPRAEREVRDPGIEVGILADGTIRFWCFAKHGRAFRLSLREGKKGATPVYRETDEWFGTGPEAEAEVAARNGKAVRRA
jgi:hypothetical protein